MNELDLIYDLHRDGPRQGPGSDTHTSLAIDLSGLRGRKGLKIADIGCGSGAPTRVLARQLDAQIVAVDFLDGFLDTLRTRAEQDGTGNRIETLTKPMEELDLAAESLDAIWSEGAIYNIGFEQGVAAWRRFLKPGGVLAVSELTWLTGSRPAELQAHWAEAYPGVDTASAKIAVLERHGFSPLGYFVLPSSCWLDNYYRPMQARFDAFVARHDHSDAARAIVAAEEAEIALYQRYADYVSYGYYVARRNRD